MKNCYSLMSTSNSYIEIKTLLEIMARLNYKFNFITYFSHIIDFTLNSMSETRQKD